MRFRAEHLRPHGWTPPQTLHVPDWCGCTTEVPPSALGGRLVGSRADLGSCGDAEPLATVRPARVALTAMAIHRLPGPPTLPTAAWINKPLTALALAAAEGILYRASR